MSTLSNAKPNEAGKNLPTLDLHSMLSPEVQNSQTGVSVECAPDETKQWFVLRISYGRYSKVCDNLRTRFIEFYLPLHHTIKIRNNRKKKIYKYNSMMNSIKQQILPMSIFMWLSLNFVTTKAGTK